MPCCGPSSRVGCPGYGNYRVAPMPEHILSLSAGPHPVEINLPDMKIGLYTLYLYGQIDPQGRKDLGRVWKPCPLRFQLRAARRPDHDLWQSAPEASLLQPADAGLPLSY